MKFLSLIVVIFVVTLCIGDSNAWFIQAGFGQPNQQVPQYQGSRQVRENMNVGWGYSSSANPKTQEAIHHVQGNLQYQPVKGVTATADGHFATDWKTHGFRAGIHVG
jgi:hypothetical protein